MFFINEHRPEIIIPDKMYKDIFQKGIIKRLQNVKNT